MIIITNNSRDHSVYVNKREIAPKRSAKFDSVDTAKLNYLISTGDVSVRYEADEAKPKNVTRKSSIKDTIIIDSAATSNEDVDA